jgi:hypothetical protein
MSEWKTTEDYGHGIVVEHHDSGIRATIKWDGCVDYLEANNGDWDDTDYLHICSLDRMIEQLRELKELGKAKFGEEWES